MTKKINSQDIRQKTREFILEHFPTARQQNITDEDLLLGNNIIDSMGILEIVTFIEKEFIITVDDEEFMPENFQSIADIANFVQSKQHH